LIFSLPGSLRSLWAPVVVCVGLVFSLVGALTAAPVPGSGIDIAGLAIGAVATVGGLVFAWGGLRMGVVRRGTGLRVREVVGGDTYETEQIQGFGVGEEEHHLVPLTIIYPTIRLVDGGEIQVTSLATFRVVPGARGQALRAAHRMAAWTGKAVGD